MAARRPLDQFLNFPHTHRIKAGYDQDSEACRPVRTARRRGSDHVPCPGGGAPGLPCPDQGGGEAVVRLQDRQAAQGAAAIKGVRVNHIPKGFTYGGVGVNKHNGITEYGYQWSDDHSDENPRHRSLWVRVVCWPKASKTAQLKNAPLSMGAFSGDTRTMKIGGRQVLTQAGGGPHRAVEERGGHLPGGRLPQGPLPVGSGASVILNASTAAENGTQAFGAYAETHYGHSK